jgi:hypothetical protein
MDQDITVRLDKMYAAIKPYAKARAERIYIENFLRCKKAILMQEAPEEYTTIAAKEAYAYSHEDYISLVKSLKAAVEIEEKTRWALEHLKIQFEYWRTTQANERWALNKL